jgi:hypothetical protein
VAATPHGRAVRAGDDGRGRREPLTAVTGSWVDASAALLADLGFTLDHTAADLAPGGAALHVALRDRPTLRHFDPEAIGYWVERDGRGRHAILDRDLDVPWDGEFEWGDVRVVDRLGESNRFLVFGGEVTAAEVDETLQVVRFRSVAPILRAGGHSQGVDPIEPWVGAFFGRIMIPVDYTPGAEGRLAEVNPGALYAAFLVDTDRRIGGGHPSSDPTAVEPLRREISRVRSQPVAWASGVDLLDSLGLEG